ncbi:hypothetical protein AVEN_14367-1, partial [Araneus ventricosus]
FGELPAEMKTTHSSQTVLSPQFGQALRKVYITEGGFLSPSNGGISVGLGNGTKSPRGVEWSHHDSVSIAGF